MELDHSQTVSEYIMQLVFTLINNICHRLSPDNSLAPSGWFRYCRVEMEWLQDLEHNIIYRYLQVGIGKGLSRIAILANQYDVWKVFNSVKANSDDAAAAHLFLYHAQHINIKLEATS